MFGAGNPNLETSAKARNPATGNSRAHEQVEAAACRRVAADFNRNQAGLAPLLSDSQVAGVMAFELNDPDEVTLFAERFEMAAGTVFGLALTKEGQEHWAEPFAQVAGVHAAPVRAYDTRLYGVSADAPADGRGGSGQNL